MKFPGPRYVFSILLSFHPPLFSLAVLIDGHCFLSCKAPIYRRSSIPDMKSGRLQIPQQQPRSTGPLHLLNQRYSARPREPIHTLQALTDLIVRTCTLLL